MQRYIRFICVFLLYTILFCLISPVYAQTETVIDTSHESNGYFTINYSDSNPVKMKVGVTYNKSTIYYDYTANEISSYAFTQGNGIYVINLFRNVSGTKYKYVDSKKVKVTLEDPLSPYLVSTREVEFTEDDDVSVKATEICCDESDTYSKVTALCKFISENISYDYELAEKIINGSIKTYHPNACDILNNKKGICYDYAVLFAAMCRSQDIPCSVEKGYIGNSYHSWNRVYIDDKWYIVDFMIYYNNTLIS